MKLFHQINSVHFGIQALFYIRLLIFECHRKRNKYDTENNYLFMIMREIAFIYNARIVRSGNYVLTSFFVATIV